MPMHRHVLGKHASKTVEMNEEMESGALKVHSDANEQAIREYKVDDQSLHL